MNTLAKQAFLRRKLWICSSFWSNQSLFLLKGKKGGGFKVLIQPQVSLMISQLPCWSLVTAHSYIFEHSIISGTRPNCQVTFSSQLPSLVCRQQHLWRSVLSENLWSTMKSSNLTQCQDSNPWSSDHKDYALAYCALDRTEGSNQRNVLDLGRVRIRGTQVSGMMLYHIGPSLLVWILQHPQLPLGVWIKGTATLIQD